jgi:nitrogen fixation protein FixH
MSWGNKILIGFLVFVVGMSSMVYIAMKQTNEMVDGNYYEKELAFQDKIDAAKHLNALQEKVSIEYKNDYILIKLPKQATSHQPKGIVQFLRSSEQSKDINVALTVNENGELRLSKSKFIAGAYQLTIDWADGNVSYYYNQQVIIHV